MENFSMVKAKEQKLTKKAENIREVQKAEEQKPLSAGDVRVKNAAGRLPAEKVNENIRRNLPPVVKKDDVVLAEVKADRKYRTNVLKNREDFLRRFEALEQNHFKQKENGRKVYDSTLMKNVKDSMRELNTFLEKQIDKKGRGVNAMYSAMSARYDKAIKNAEIYLKKRNPHSDEGLDRWAAVLRLKTDLEYERSQLRTAIQFAKLDMRDKKKKNLYLVMNYGDILRYCRGVHITTPVEKKAEGGSMSTVFEIKGDRDRRLFKTAERKIETSLGNVFDAAEKETDRKLEEARERAEASKKKSSTRKKQPDSVKNAGEKQALIIRRFLDGLKVIIGEVEKKLEFNSKGQKDAYEKIAAKGLMYMLTRESYKDFWSEVDAWRKFLPQEGMVKEEKDYLNISSIVKEYVMSFTSASLENAIDRELKISSAARKKLFVKGITSYFGRAFKPTLTANYNRIHDGADLTSRNVATNRMCSDILKFDDNIVVSSKNATIVADGEFTDGIIMSRAKGISMEKLRKKLQEADIPRENRCMTPAAAKQLFQLQLLDMICGQCDRHTENIFVQYDAAMWKENVLLITGFTGIDNDMSFGNITSDTLKTGFNRLSFMQDEDGKTAFKHIDEETYNKIMGINPEDVKFRLVDIGMNNDEMNALLDRIAFMKETLKAEADKDDGFVVKDIADCKDILNVYNAGGRQIPKENGEGTKPQDSPVAFLYSLGATQIDNSNI